MKKTALLHLDHAPNYREVFLRKLGEEYNLIVIAHSCEKNNLTPPKNRIGYKYHELNFLGDKLRFNNELKHFIRLYDPDVICISLNLRYPFRFLTFLRNKRWQQKWVWWGQIFGRNDNILINKVKKLFLDKSKGTLVYTEDIKDRLSQYDNIISFNNSQFSKEEFVQLDQTFENKLKCLFVGRPQDRKKLEFLFLIANERKDLDFRLVGPGMIDYFKNKQIPDNLELLPAAYGEELTKHFEWANLIVNPGHVGLLVMNAATHCRPIVINDNVGHAPELILAKEANQFFINFNDFLIVNKFFDRVIQDKELLKIKGDELFTVGIQKYTVENMVNAHIKMFDTVTETNQ